MDQTDDNQQLDEFCSRWAVWHRSRRLFAPPIPQNILARMRPQPVRQPPDAILSADLSYFNLALLSIPEGNGKAAFYYFYLHELRPIKAVADGMGISTQAFYKGLKKARADAFKAYSRIMAWESETEKVDNNAVDETTG